MKKLIAALTVCVYFVPISVFFMFSTITSEEASGAGSIGSLLIPIILMVVVCALVIANIIVAVVSAIRARSVTFRAIMVFKLCLIPFYIVNFICWGIASAVFHIALVVWPLIPFIILYTYLTMLGTSVHNITHLILLRKNKMISTKRCVLHCIFQLTFTIDVIDSVYLTIKHKQSQNVSGITSK